MTLVSHPDTALADTALGTTGSGVETGKEQVVDDGEEERSVVTETDARYFDSDGDGLLDAVEIIETMVLVGAGYRRVLSETRATVSKIGDDGVPHHVAA